jgi:hypothetical protein
MHKKNHNLFPKQFQEEISMLQLFLQQHLQEGGVRGLLEGLTNVPIAQISPHLCIGSINIR